MKKLTALLFISFFFSCTIHAQTTNSDSTFTGHAQTTNYDSLIHQYCKEHKLIPAKTASGLYYVIKKAGNGQQVADSQKITVNYTGSLIDGTVFDSNTKKKYNHKEPFQYKAGAGQIIKGFDEGDKLLHVGGSAILIIPPYLGYGDKDLKVIPPNSILVFEVQILDVN